MIAAHISKPLSKRIFYFQNKLLVFLGTSNGQVLVYSKLPGFDHYELENPGILVSEEIDASVACLSTSPNGNECFATVSNNLTAISVP